MILMNIPVIAQEKMAGLNRHLKDGTVTAGNASGINDGAAAVIVMSKEKVMSWDYPMAKIISYASEGVDPKIMGLDLCRLRKKHLKSWVNCDDIELIEANEAFASVNCSGQRNGLG